MLGFCIFIVYRNTLSALLIVLSLKVYCHKLVDTFRRSFGFIVQFLISWLDISKVGLMMVVFENFCLSFISFFLKPHCILYKSLVV